MKSPLQKLPVYKKAVELYTLSRKLTSYITHNKELNELYMATDPSEQDLEIMIVESLGLAPSIALVQTAREESKRQYYINKLKHAITKLNYRLQAVKSRNHRDHDYLNLFKRELQHFQLLLQQWSLSVLHKN